MYNALCIAVKPIIHTLILHNLHSLSAVISLQLAPVSTVRAPVGAGTLPLSCAFTISDIVIESTLMLEWNKLATNDERVPITADASNTTMQVYRSSRGIDYYVSTLFLCDLEFSDAGAYECTAQATLKLESVRESAASPIFNVSVHGTYDSCIYSYHRL